MSFIKNIAAHWVANRTASALSRLSDYELKDIGVSRSEIRHIARKSSGLPV